MKIYAPNYYKNFKCIADKCKHSCCIGWDIYIDDNTLDRYLSSQDEVLKGNIEFSEDGARFAMGEDKRCPYLASSGLCDIICKMGEGALCDICREHPRFYHSYTNRTEVGLGLCCEEAARTILSQHEKTKIEYFTEDDEPEYATYPEEQQLIADRDRLIEILGERSLTIEERIEKAVGEIPIYFDTDHMYEYSPQKWSRFLYTLERLDHSWDGYLDDLYKYGSYDPIPDLDLPLEKLVIYFVYRHASGCIGELDFAEGCRFAFVSYRIIKAICNSQIRKNGKIEFDQLVDICRAFSAEIEYSDENMDYIYK